MQYDTFPPILNYCLIKIIRFLHLVSPNLECLVTSLGLDLYKHTSQISCIQTVASIQSQSLPTGNNYQVFNTRYRDLTKCKWSCAILADASWGKAELWDGAGTNQGQIRGGNGLSERQPGRILRRTQGETQSPAGKCSQCRWEREEPAAQCKNIHILLWV